MVHQCPIDTSAANFNALGSFDHEIRSLPCMTLARGEGNVAKKADRIAHTMILENNTAHMSAYHSEVKGFLADRGTEKGVKKFPYGGISDIQEVIHGIKAGTIGVLGEQASRLQLFWNAFENIASLHVMFNALESALKALPEGNFLRSSF